jgi:hypothetical protein
MRAAPWKGGASALCGVPCRRHSESSQPAQRREARNLLLFLAAPRRASSCLLLIRLFQHAAIGSLRAPRPSYRRIRSGFSVNSRASRSLCHESTAKDHRLHRKPSADGDIARPDGDVEWLNRPTAHSRLRHARVLPFDRHHPVGAGCATRLRGSLRIPDRNIWLSAETTGSAEAA